MGQVIALNVETINSFCVPHLVEVSAFRILSICFAFVMVTFICYENVSFGSSVIPRILGCFVVGNVWFNLSDKVVLYSDVLIPNFKPILIVLLILAVRVDLILPIPPILFHLLSTINKNFCKPHQRMYLLNLACYCILNFFWVSLFITRILQNCKRKLNKSSRWFL